jgi:phage/plasmid-like protein (TIGR03299 family)
MAHEIEYRNGRWSFAFVGERSAIWHRKGQQAGEDWTQEQWQEAAGHNFTVRKVPLIGLLKDRAEIGDLSELDDAALDIDTHEALIREDTCALLSVVSKEWPEQQNQAGWDFAQPFVDEGLASYNTAGTLYDGGRCFILLKTKDGFSLPGGDDTELYVLVQISHQYGIADECIPTAVRVVCANTLRLAMQADRQQRKMKGAGQVGKFRHLEGTKFRVEKAQGLIEAYRLGLGEYAEKAKYLSTKRASPEQTRAYVNRVFQLEELKNGTAKEIERRHEHNKKVVANLLQAVETQPGAEMSRGSFWSLYHGVTFWEDHGRWIGDDTKRAGSEKLEPVTSKFAGAGSDRKTRAFEVALEMAG